MSPGREGMPYPTHPPRFNYDAEPKEHVPDCNLCGPRMRPFVVAREDRYGFPQTFVSCPTCGLIWATPRMTLDGYRRFYESGAYREVVGKHVGHEVTLGSIQSDQRTYVTLVEDVIPPANGPVLDVGGSAGIVGHAFGDQVTVLDPAASELAASSGETILQTVEEWEPGDRKWDTILCCRTLDHVLDPREALLKFREAVSPGGKLWVDVVRWQVYASLMGRIEGAMKIDHPFAFMEGVLLRYLKATGWTPVRRKVIGRSVGFLCG